MWQEDYVLAALPATPRQLEVKLKLTYTTVSRHLNNLEKGGRAHRAEAAPGKRRNARMWRPGPAPDPKQAVDKVDVGAGFRGDPLLNALFGGKQSE